MENSRRSALDGPRDPAFLKRPRLTPEEPVVSTTRDRPFPRLRASAADQQVLPSRSQRSAAAAAEREERDEPSRGGSYQELFAEYNTALAELTFNSKPIITNLTIIAGENLHAAKGIAAIICANILQVPSDQKLPSLYLLDSIVKNIGRDYIRYFAASLPNVFCKAYKQVDPSIHPSMRHLFGTWKGVFPSAPLQLIEKELGFVPIVNGSSASASSKLDVQTQRPPRSIHVNPKYLESRHTVQQPTRVKELVNNDGLASLLNEKEKPEKTAGLGSVRQWTNLASKGEAMRNAFHEKKSFINVRDHEFSSDVTQDSDILDRKTSERSKEHSRPLYAGGFGSPEALNRRDGFDVNNSYDVYLASGSARANNQPSSSDLNDSDRNSIGSSKSWKNSEEEEYAWDDMSSKASDYGSSSSLMKGVWKNDGSDKPVGPQGDKWNSLETKHLELSLNKDNLPRPVRSIKGAPYKVLEEHLMQPHPKYDNDSRASRDLDSLARQTASEYRRSSPWATNETSSPATGLNHDNSRVGQLHEGKAFSLGANLSAVSSSVISLPVQPPHASNPSSRSYANMLCSSGAFGQRLHHVQLPSPSAYSQSIQQHKPQNLANCAHLRSDSFSQVKPIHLPGQANQIRHAPRAGDTFCFSTKSHAQSLLNASYSIDSLSEPSKNLESTSALLGQGRENRFSMQHQPSQTLRQIETQSQTSLQTENLLPLSQGFEAKEMAIDSGTSSSNNNSFEPLGHSSTSNLLAAILKSGLLPNNSLGNFQNPAVQPPLPSGPPPIQVLTSAVSSMVPSLLTPTSHNNAQATRLPPDRDVLPPLPPGPPPASSVLVKNSANSNSAESTANPLSSLLSSLVAKGLISSPAAESLTSSAAHMLNKLEPDSSNAPKLILPHSATANIAAAPAKESPSEAVDPENGSSSHSATKEWKELLGMEFRQETIRASHPSVISSLFDNLNHECNLCGIRFKQEQQLLCHLNWHKSKKPEVSNSSRKSRRWFVKTINWVSGSKEPQTGLTDDITFEDIILPEEKSELMVPADESQSICALCGEPFGDIYSEERDEWMYRGTVYFNSPIEQNDASFIGQTVPRLPIVHAECMSQISTDNKSMNDEVVPPFT